MTRRWLSVDIEIAALIPDDAADWKAHRPLGITCAACAWQEEDGEIKTEAVHGWSKAVRYAPRMYKFDCQALVGRLQNAVIDGYTLLCWNGNFDFDILAEESGMHAECVELAMNHVDPCFQVLCTRGYPIGLGDTCRGMGLLGKTEGMSGSLAPQMWAAGKYDEVLAYVRQDTRMTLELASIVERTHALRWIAKSGKLHFLHIPRWLTVAECLLLPTPDTNWIKGRPITRGGFTAWLGTSRAKGGDDAP